MSTKQKILIGCLIALGLIFLASAGRFIYTRVAGTVVDVVSPQQRDVAEIIIATGQLTLEPHSTLALELSGTVAHVYVQEGDEVQAGQILLELNPSEHAQRLNQAEAALDTMQMELQRLKQGAPTEDVEAARAQLVQATTRLKHAHSELERAQRLWDDGLTTHASLELARSNLVEAKSVEAAAQASYDAIRALPRQNDLRVMQARVVEAEAAVKLARDTLRRTRLIAPFDGLITWRAISPGEATTAGAPLLRIANTQYAQIYVETDETNVSRLEKGQHAVVIPAAFPDQSFNSKVLQIGPEIDPERGVVGIRLEPISLPDIVFAEMTVDVNIVVAEYDKALSLPRSAVAEDDRGYFIMVVQNGHASRRTVAVLAESIDIVAITGIAADVTVVGRVAEVDDGQRVRARNGGT